MYDNSLLLGLLIFATVLAVVGLVLVFLQKKGICFTGIPFYGRFCMGRSLSWLTY